MEAKFEEILNDEIVKSEKAQMSLDALIQDVEAMNTNASKAMRGSMGDPSNDHITKIANAIREVNEGLVNRYNYNQVRVNTLKESLRLYNETMEMNRKPN